MRRDYFSPLTPASRRSLVFAMTSDVPGSGQKPLLDPARTMDALHDLARLARDQGTRIALIGGLAMQRYGSERLTRDVDVAASAVLAGITVTRALSFGGVEGTAPNGVPVDVVVRDDDYAGLYEEAIAAARTVPDLPIPLARPEHLAAMKMAAGRAKDLGDLEHLVRAASIDRSVTRDIVRRHLGPYAARELDVILDEIDWKIERGME